MDDTDLISDWRMATRHPKQRPDPGSTSRSRRMRRRAGPSCPCCGVRARDIVLRAPHRLGSGRGEAMVLVLADGIGPSTAGTCPNALEIARRTAVIFDPIHRVLSTVEVSRPFTRFSASDA